LFDRFHVANVQTKNENIKATDLETLNKCLYNKEVKKPQPLLVTATGVNTNPAGKRQNAASETAFYRDPASSGRGIGMFCRFAKGYAPVWPEPERLAAVAMRRVRSHVYRRGYTAG